MTTISRTTTSNVLPGADLESAINNVLQETNGIASSMAQDVVESIKQNNKTLKTLRDLKAAVREKDGGLLGQLLAANPDLKSALEKVMGEIPAEKTISVPTTRIDPPRSLQDGISGFLADPLRAVQGMVGGVLPGSTRTTSSETQRVPISDEAWESLGKNLDDLMENFNAFGQEAQIGLQNVMTRVSQSFTAMSNVSSKFASTADGIIGNIRG